MGQNRPLYVYFCPFHNAMTNKAHNFAHKCRKVWDSNLGPADERMFGAEESTEPSSAVMHYLTAANFLNEFAAEITAPPRINSY